MATRQYWCFHFIPFKIFSFFFIFAPKQMLILDLGLTPSLAPCADCQAGTAVLSVSKSKACGTLSKVAVW